MGPRAKNLDTLTALRGLASLTVLFFHANMIVTVSSGAALGIGRGYLAVDFFFMLSGFVLAHVYGGTISQPGAMRSFLWARFARIYPTHLAVLVMLLPFFGTVGFSGVSLALSLVLMQVPWDPNNNSWNGAAWSISCEIYSYVLFLFVARRMLAGGAFCRITAIAAAEAIVLLIWHEGAGNVASGFGAIYRSVPEFLIGIALYRVYAQSLARRVLELDRVALIAAGAIIGLSLLPTMPADMGIVALLALLLIAVAQNRGRVARLLESGPAQYLGKISYSLYLIQVVPAQLLVTYVHALPPALLSPMAIAASYIGSSLAGAALLSQIVEYPAREWLRRWPVGRSVKTETVAGIFSPHLPLFSTDSGNTNSPGNACKENSR